MESFEKMYPNICAVLFTQMFPCPKYLDNHLSSRRFQPYDAYDASAWETTTVRTGVMGDVSLLEPIQGLLDDRDLMGKMVESARLYWTNNFLTVDIFSSLFNGMILILAGVLFIYVFDLLAISNLGQQLLQKKSYEDMASEEATYTLGAILELQQQVNLIITNIVRTFHSK